MSLYKGYCYYYLLYYYVVIDDGDNGVNWMQQVSKWCNK